MFDLSGKTYLVTGASRGIGAATAKILLESGACVVGSYASAPGNLDSLVTDYGSKRVLPVQADLSQMGAAHQLWEQAVAFNGHVDGLVNNAGVMPEAYVSGSDEDWHASWHTTMMVNIQSVADLCKYAICHFKPRGGGHIVSIASRAAFRGDGIDYMHYAASKGAVVSLMRSIARGYARDGIYGFIIAPGWVKTDMAAVAYEPGNEWMLDEIPMGEAAPPSDVGNMVAMLMSGNVNHATGTTIDINGASYVR
ncbi:NAD-dependent epimerase [Kordiimonas sediminis]|uniref:NAD-dependent epimerase n=1 Tax=Kordiimonas sediminis TaxID=1735581 RepID=A0A919EAX1_9PROT|nr:SDR family oxidoreductase [Kordiimonas sediminis]GHF29789.1 NAD-dependent epimerase [Kordiimonas sediminis]